MQMQLNTSAIGPELALRPGDDRLGKGAGFAHQDGAPLPCHVANGREQNGVAKRRTLRRWIDREDVAAAR